MWREGGREGGRKERERKKKKKEKKKKEEREREREKERKQNEIEKKSTHSPMSSRNSLSMREANHKQGNTIKYDKEQSLYRA